MSEVEFKVAVQNAEGEEVESVSFPGDRLDTRVRTERGHMRPGIWSDPESLTCFAKSPELANTRRSEGCPPTFALPPTADVAVPAIDPHFSRVPKSRISVHGIRGVALGDAPGRVGTGWGYILIARAFRVSKFPIFRFGGRVEPARSPRTRI